MSRIKIEFIKEQSFLTRDQTLKILSEVPDDLWYETPKIIDSNIAWQVGHLIVSQYYHSIAVITGENRELFSQVPLQIYFPIYSMFTKSTTNDLSPEPKQLLYELALINDYSTTQIDGLEDSDLDKPLEATQLRHPIAKTKYEALTWNFRHEMWHLGQISTIKKNNRPSYEMVITILKSPKMKPVDKEFNYTNPTSSVQLLRESLDHKRYGLSLSH